MLRWASRFTWFYRLVWLQPSCPHCPVGQGSLHCSGSTFSFFSPAFGDIVTLPEKENCRSIPENEVPEHYLQFLHIFKFKTSIVKFWGSELGQRFASPSRIPLCTSSVLFLPKNSTTPKHFQFSDGPGEYFTGRRVGKGFTSLKCVLPFLKCWWSSIITRTIIWISLFQPC